MRRTEMQLIDRLAKSYRTLTALAVVVLLAASPAAAGDFRLVENSERAFLGVQIDSDPDGVRITGIVDDSAAEGAGRERGDVIVGLGRSSVTEIDELSSVMRSHAPGDLVGVTVLRDGEEIAVDASLGSRSRGLQLESDEEFTVVSPHMRGMVHGEMSIDEDDLRDVFVCSGDCRFSEEQDWLRADCIDRGCETYTVRFWKRPMLGVQLSDTTEELRAFFGSDGKTGVLVSKVMSGSPAELGGVEVGDLIVAVEGRAVHEPDDIGRAIREMAGETVEVEVFREGRPLRLTAGLLGS